MAMESIIWLCVLGLSLPKLSLSQDIVNEVLEFGMQRVGILLTKSQVDSEICIVEELQQNKHWAETPSALQLDSHQLNTTLQELHQSPTMQPSALPLELGREHITTPELHALLVDAAEQATGHASSLLHVYCSGSDFTYGEITPRWVALTQFRSVFWC
ncbi:hypothetical protein FRB95_002088 [Tulasnella sp. JGI-2019a]|nr:hypothetical protein FRB95_002088 [Tulasnella sp. JGI-2019a]